MNIYLFYAVLFSYKLPALLILINVAIAKASRSQVTNLGHQITENSFSGEIRTPVSPEESVPTLTYYKALSHNIESKEQPAGTRTGLGTHIKRQKNEEKAFASTFYIENKHNEATPSSKIFESGNHWLQSNEILWKECLASPDCYSIIHQSSNENMYQEFLTIFEQYAEKIQPGDEISSFPSLNLILKVINFIQKHDLEKVAIINTLFLNDEPVKTLIWYTDTVLFENRGVIGLFQAFRIKKFVADHPDLKHVSALLYSKFGHPSKFFFPD
ncbi:hypothetical protein BY996DRAFT_6408454 [Phakopsora pachyrhizi]|nr:hypothetical protein BY996DRAFT_6408454 [Phakopsora pachyrhizi]